MDILFFAALAAYIFFKLRNQLGKVDEDQRREAIKKFLREQADIVKKTQNPHGNEDIDGKKLISQEDAALDKENISILNSLPQSLQNELSEVLKKSKVNPKDFLSGANNAFEMIINDYSKGDIDGSKFLLSKELYEKFLSSIKDRQKNKQFLNINIVSIDKSTFTGAQIKNDEAIISVNFVSQQILFTENENGEIINGDKNEISEIDEIWTFSRNINSKNPNWTVISTNS